MKSFRSLVSVSALLALAPFALAADAGFKSIFNGKDLTGWEGLSFWSVKDGAIVGQTTAEKPTKGNTFLLWKDGTLANFELRLKFRLTAQNEKAFGNSGIQYRSKVRRRRRLCGRGLSGRHRSRRRLRRHALRGKRPRHRHGPGRENQNRRHHHDRRPQETRRQEIQDRG